MAKRLIDIVLTKTFKVTIPDGQDPEKFFKKKEQKILNRMCYPRCLNPGCNSIIQFNTGGRPRPFCGYCRLAWNGKNELKKGVKFFLKGRCSDPNCATDWDKVWARCKEHGIRPSTEVDHKNGNPWDNTSENCQELCKICHTLKGRQAGDLGQKKHKLISKKYAKIVFSYKPEDGDGEEKTFTVNAPRDYLKIY